MSDQFIGEIRMFAGNYAPQDWALCNGQQLQISQNDTLYSLIGTTYGGDGVTTFNLPDMRGRIPVHMGSGTGLTPRVIGQNGGTETVAITDATMPQHTHPFSASTNDANSITPASTKVLGKITGANTPGFYSATTTMTVPMNAASVTTISGGMSHSNLMPSLCINFIIALAGYFPQRGCKEENMADPFLGEIRLFTFNFAPQGWATCDGQLLQINQNNALYSLLGTMYGGDGKTNFNLPDLKGRTGILFASGYAQGTKSGVEGVILSQSQIPVHIHSLQATSDTTALTNVPSGNVFSTSRANYPIYADVANLVPINTGTIGLEGGGTAHNNMQPFLVINFCIAISGIYPPRS